MNTGSEHLLKEAESKLECAAAEMIQLHNAIIRLEDRNIALRECLLDAMQDFDETAPWVARAKKLME